MTTVYGTLLNFQNAVAQLSEEMNAPPYNHPPKAPILYIKPQNTFNENGRDVGITESVEVGATIGMVIKKRATKVNRAEYNSYVEGYIIVNDLTLPHDNYYRPAYPKRARDGFCPMGDTVGSIEPNNAKIRVFVNDEQRLESTTTDLVRNAAELLTDVTDFMTLYEGDILLLGVDAGMPIVNAGDTVRIEVDGLGVLENTFVTDEVNN